jgi:hypothetical protein
MFATHGSGGSCVAAHRQGEPARAEPVTPHVAQFFLPSFYSYSYAKPAAGLAADDDDDGAELATTSKTASSLRWSLPGKHPARMRGRGGDCYWYSRDLLR